MTDTKLPQHIIEKFERRWELRRARDLRFRRTETGAGYEGAKRATLSPSRPHRGPELRAPRLAS